jgi:sulfur carrier protein ThiS
MKVKKATTIALLLEEHGINRETVVVSINGEIAIEEEGVLAGDEVKFIRIVSGG